MICLPDKFHVSRRFPRTVYFKIDFGAYVDGIFFHKLVSESYKPYLHFLSFFLLFFFFLFFPSRNELQKSSNVSAKEKYIPRRLTVL